MPETVAHCRVSALDRRTITVFVWPPLSSADVEATLQKASGRLPGTRILGVKLGDDVYIQDHANQYLFGTRGLLQFSDAQSNEKLDAALKLIADVFLADHFKVVGPLEAVPQSTEK